MKFFKFFFLSVMFLGIGMNASAQKYAVKGVVADSTGTGEPFATVRIFSRTDTVKPVATLVTSEEGLF